MVRTSTYLNDKPCIIFTLLFCLCLPSNPSENLVGSVFKTSRPPTSPNAHCYTFLCVSPCPCQGISVYQPGTCSYNVRPIQLSSRLSAPNASCLIWNRSPTPHNYLEDAILSVAVIFWDPLLLCPVSLCSLYRPLYCEHTMHTSASGLWSSRSLCHFLLPGLHGWLPMAFMSLLTCLTLSSQEVLPGHTK